MKAQASAQGPKGLETPQIRAALVGWMVAGESLRDCARRLLGEYGVSVSAQAVQKFQRRHGEEIAKINARAVAKIENPVIMQKAERLRRLSTLYDDMEQIRTERGLMAEDVKWVGGGGGKGGFGREVTVSRFDAALVREMRAALDDVARELGERVAPEPPPPERRDDGFSTLILNGDSAIRELAQHLFAAMGARDAVRLGEVREPGIVDAVAAPDDGQRRPATDRGG